MLQAIIGTVLKFGLGALIEWLRGRSVEKAKKQKDALEVAIEATAEAEKDTEKYKKLVEKHEKAAAKVTKAEDKLAAIRKFTQKSKEENKKNEENPA